MDRGQSAILVGVGNVGRAFMCNFPFQKYGVNIAAAFDTNPDIIGMEYNGTEILDAEKIPEFLNGHKVDMAVLCVPGARARAVTDILTENGIDAIWNFTNMDIVDPYSGVLVENMHFSDSLLELNYYMTERERQREAKKLRQDSREATII